MHDTNINQIDGWNVSEKTEYNLQPQKLYNATLFILVDDLFLTSQLAVADYVGQFLSFNR